MGEACVTYLGGDIGLVVSDEVEQESHQFCKVKLNVFVKIVSELMQSEKTLLQSHIVLLGGFEFSEHED